MRFLKNCFVACTSHYSPQNFQQFWKPKGGTFINSAPFVYCKWRLKKSWIGTSLNDKTTL